MSTTTSNKYTSTSDINEDCYTTQLKFRNLKFNWIIEDFEFVCKTMKIIESPKFPSTKMEKMKWYFQIEPVELKEDNQEIFKISLMKTHDVDTYIILHFSILNSSGNGSHFSCSFRKLDAGFMWCQRQRASKFYQDLLCDNSLPKNVTLTCELRVYESIKDIIKKPLINSLESGNLAEQIECAFDEQSFKDVTFQVEEKEFNAHKTILALRSPVFAAMFKSKMREELTSNVEIKDIKPRIFHKMLRFIYTEKVANLEGSAVELFYAAEKYQLEKLKTMCINSLYTNLSLETVVKTLVLADLFSVSNLKDKSLEYLINHLKVIQETDEFVELLESHAHLVQDIFKMQNTIIGHNKKKVGLNDFKMSVFEFGKLS